MVIHTAERRTIATGPGRNVRVTRSAKLFSQQGLMTTLRKTIVAATAAGIALASVAEAQQASRKPAARASAAPVEKPVVVVMPVDETPGDSARTIIQRDLDYGDRLTPLALDASLLKPNAPPDGSVNYSFFAGFKVAAIVAPRRSSTGLRVAVYDVATQAVLRESDFAVPEVPALRETEIRDSVIRAWEQRDLESRAGLVRTTFLRDSLVAAAAKKPPRNRKKRAAEAAVRDSLMRQVAREDSVLRAGIDRDVAERDAALPLLVARDLALRDSLVLAQRFALHGIADEVQRWLTGHRGMAQSRVAYVQNGRVFVVDSDGANNRPATQTGTALSPSWHPSGTRVVFADLNDAGTQIVEANLVTGGLRELSATPRGLNLTPVYTPDGRSVVYAHARDAGADLVIANLEGPAPARRISSLELYDRSSPSFSPDGRRLAFISPRSWQGTRMTPQLFTMNLDGSEEKQLTPSAKGVRSYRTSPDWSPDGLRVAYMQQNGDFQVWLIDVRTQAMKRLTTFAENEDPTWAPDSRHIAIASTRGGTKEIWVMDVESGRMRQLTDAPGARLPAWSPVIQPPAAAPVAVAGRGDSGGK
ncbi:MAG: PD40 domain-containing protein [Gemmatimonadaceae bacterium]|nr:PD40 domain-containing protein [Gemmatimonadaceae bacterium]